MMLVAVAVRSLCTRVCLACAFVSHVARVCFACRVCLLALVLLIGRFPVHHKILRFVRNRELSN